MAENGVEMTNSEWSHTDCILKICGDSVTLTQAHEKDFLYGGKRKRLKYDSGKVVRTLLGRASEADEAQKCVNAQRVLRRRNNRIRDLMNCNAWQLTNFETLTGVGDYRNLHEANADKKHYLDRLERFVRTGRVGGKSVRGFVPRADFHLRVLGVPEFQDGHRNANGIGTGNVHFHHFHNAPYLPQVFVIHAKQRDPVSQDFCEVYLNKPAKGRVYWTKVAGKDTVWFNAESESLRFLRLHQKSLSDMYFNPEPKKLCVNALLWREGHTKIKKLQDLRKQGKLSNPGEYLCQYVSSDVSDDRLKGRHGWYKRGSLQQPQKIRDPHQVNAYIAEVDLWKFFTHQYEFVATYVGAMTQYFFDFWMEVYPWIKRMYELKSQGKRMEKADWLACGVVAASPR
jgi:hypothetical protein